MMMGCPRCCGMVPTMPSSTAAHEFTCCMNCGQVLGDSSQWGHTAPPLRTSAGTTPFSSPYTESARQEFGAHQHGFVSRSSAAAFPSSWDPPATQMETRGPSSPYEFDPILGRPRTSWDLPRPQIAPELCSNHSYSESYRGGGGYSNNYNDYYNNEPQAWTYKPPQPTPCYNHVPQSVQCEPQPPAQYYAEPQQQPYYPPPPSHTHGQTTVTSPAMPSPLELHQSPPTAETLDEQDRAANLELCDMINHEGFSRVDLIRGMKKRIMLESPRIQYLSLELLESVAKNCEKAFSATAATKEKMVQKENKDVEVMENRIIDMNTEEEFVLGDEATLEAGEAPASGSSKNSLQASPLLPTDGEMYGGTFYPTIKEFSISLHALRPPSTGLVEQIELEIDEGKMKLSNESNGPMLSPLPSSAKIRKGGVADFAYEKRARSNRHEAGGYTSRVPFTQPRRSWHNEDQRIVGFAENGNGSSCRKLSFGSRRLVIFCLYDLEEVYKDFCISTLRTR